jgi:hypothetical protein
MNKYLHILRLLDRKFHLLYLLLFFNSIAFIAVINSDWLNILISVDLKIPFSNVLIQPKTIYLSGKDILGYFCLLPFIPLILLFFNSVKEYAWIISILTFFVTILHITNLNSVYDFIQNQSPDCLIFRIDYGLSFFAYLGLIATQSLITLLIHKTS